MRGESAWGAGAQDVCAQGCADGQVRLPEDLETKATGG